MGYESRESLHQFKEMPTGTQWLSPTLEVANHAGGRVSSYESVTLYQQAIEELKELPGGEAAYDAACITFREQEGRDVGDTAAAEARFFEKWPSQADKPWTPDEHVTQMRDDLFKLTFLMSKHFEGENNPRTPEFLKRLHAQASSQAEEMANTRKQNLFFETLPIRDQNEIKEETVPVREETKKEETGWAEIDFEDRDQDPVEVFYILENFPYYQMALRMAEQEWEELKPILNTPGQDHQFESNRENYFARRINQLLGSPLQLDAFSFTERDLGRIGLTVLDDVDCDVFLQFVDLQEIQNGRDMALQIIESRLQREPNYYDVIDVIPYTRDHEKFVRTLNQKLQSPLRLEPRKI